MSSARTLEKNKYEGSEIRAHDTSFVGQKVLPPGLLVGQVVQPSNQQNVCFRVH